MAMVNLPVSFIFYTPKLKKPSDRYASEGFKVFLKGTYLAAFQLIYNSKRPLRNVAVMMMDAVV